MKELYWHIVAFWNGLEDWQAAGLVWIIVLTIVAILILINSRLCKHEYKVVGYMSGYTLNKCTKCGKLKYRG